jgi:tryptophan halogenase
MRDFQGAHYSLNRYGLNCDGQQADAHSPFWSRVRAAPLGAELRHKIDAFRARGESVDYEDEAFTIDDWRSLLLGHGVIPESYDPAVDRTPADLLKNELQRILAFIQRKVAQQVSHSDYLHTARGK